MFQGEEREEPHYPSRPYGLGHQAVEIRDIG